MELASNRYSTLADTETYPNPNVRPTSIYSINFAEDRMASLGTSSNQALIRALESKHPLYDEYHLQWGDWYNWYAGKKIANYIYKHFREQPQFFKERQKRAYYYNYTGSIVDLLGNFVYSKSISRSFFRQDEKLAQQEHIEKNEFWVDCDLRHTSINEFMERIFIFTQIWGFVDVVIDMPKTPEELVNEQQRLEANIRPYLYPIIPTSMLNWEHDDKGEFLWVRWVEPMDKHFNPFLPKPAVKIARYTTWTRDAWYIHEITEERGQKKVATLFDAGSHDLGMVPVVRFFGKRDMLDDNIGQSFVEPIGSINIDITNSVSLLTEELRNRCVTGDTLIDCPRDLSQFPFGIPIKSLVGENFDTYSWSRKFKQFVISRAANVRLIEKKAEVWKLVYRWKNPFDRWEYGELKATPDHKILTQSGQYHELQFLREGEKLVPLTRHITEPFEGYSCIYPDNTLGSKIREHRFIVDQREELDRANDVHHKNGNRIDNRPSNLVQLTPSAHAKITAETFWQNVSDEKRAEMASKVSDGQKRYWGSKSPEELEAWGKEMSIRASAWWQTLMPEERAAFIAQRGDALSLSLQERLASMSAEELVAYSEEMKRRQAQHGPWTDEERAACSQRNSGENNPMYGRDRSGPLNPMTGKTHTPEAREKIRVARAKQTADGKLRGYKQHLMNHEVVSVEFCGYEDVYCMEVEGTHNFVANGITIHNCFNILVMEDPDQFQGADGTSSTAKGVEIGNNNALLWAGQHAPYYLAPASEPGRFILDFIAKSTEEIYKLATLWTDTGIRESRSGVSYCLAEGTCIDMPRDVLQYPDGIPIEDLVDCDPFYVYSRLLGRARVCQARRAWQSGTHQPVYRVTFTWAAYGRVYSGSIEATAHHRFMLRDGTYTKLSDLRIGDRLMHFNRSLSGDYSAVTAPGGLFREYEHRFVARSIYRNTFTDDMIVHHKNHNKLDNRIENLEVLSQHAHKVHHAADEENKRRIAKGGLKRRGEDNGRWLTLDEDHIVQALELSQGRLTHAAVHLGVCFVTLKRKMALLGMTVPHNHRVVSIEFAGYKDVFDIEVPFAHNFVANGIVVHNSYEFNRTNSMLADKAQLMEEGEIKLHRLYCKWLGEEWMGFIDYPDSYDVEVLEQELLTVTQAKNAVRSETFKRELEKRVARKVLKSDTTTDVLEAVMAEIDSMPDPQAELLAAKAQAQPPAATANDTRESSTGENGA